MATIQWFTRKSALVEHVSHLQPAISKRESLYVDKNEVPGFCSICDTTTTFIIHRELEDRLNLREGLSCAHCKLTTRQRLIMYAMNEVLKQSSRAYTPRVALLEQTTRLYRKAHSRWPTLIGSEFLGDDRASGKRYWWSARGLRWYRVRHESITSLSFEEGSLDLLVHSDVLEHVYDTHAALRESMRVLKPNGQMLFTVPFIPTIEHSILRGKPDDSGHGIVHLQSPEYHGDGVRNGGIYTFHNFGWDLLHKLREAGFSSAEVGYCFEPEEGFPSAHPNSDQSWHVLPYLFRATK